MHTAVRTTLIAAALTSFAVGCATTPRRVHPQTEAERQRDMWERWVEVLAERDHRRRDEAPRMVSSRVHFKLVTDRSAAVDPLRRQLRDRDPAFRASVATALGHIGDKRAARDLHRALWDDAPPVRAAAANALAMLGGSVRSRERKRLMALMTDSYPEVRAAAARALGRSNYYGDLTGQEAARDAITIALSDRDWRVRQSAAEAVAVVRALPGTGVRLVEIVKRDRLEVRIAAAKALPAVYQFPDGVTALIAASRDTEPRLRATAVEALSKVDDPRTVPAVMTALDDDQAAVREAAVSAMHAIGRPAVEPLLAHIRRTAPTRVTPHVEALAGIKDAAATDALVGALKDPKPEVRAAVLLVMAARGQRAIDRSQPERSAEIVQSVAARLRDTDAAVREAAADALGCMGTLVAVDPLALQLKGDDAVAVRAASAIALGAITRRYLLQMHVVPLLPLEARPPYLRAVPPLVAALADGATPVRLAALRALELIGRLEASPVETVAGLLDDPETEVRIAAVRLMTAQAKWTQPPPTDALNRALTNDRLPVRLVAVRLMTRQGLWFPRMVAIAQDEAEPAAVREAAVTGLAGETGPCPYGPPLGVRLVPLFTRLWHDASQPLAVRTAALAALTRLAPPPRPREAAAPNADAP